VKTLKAIRSVLSWISNRPKGHDWIQVKMKGSMFLDDSSHTGVVFSPIYQCLNCKTTIASDGSDNVRCEPWFLDSWHASVDQEIRSCKEEAEIASMEEALE